MEIGCKKRTRRGNWVYWLVAVNVKWKFPVTAIAPALTIFLRISRENPILLASWLSFTFGTRVCARFTVFSQVEQQIPVPDCLTLKGLWDGGYTPCAPETTKTGSRTFPTGEGNAPPVLGYNGSRYDAAAEVDAIELHAAEMMVRTAIFTIRSWEIRSIVISMICRSAYWRN